MRKHSGKQQKPRKEPYYFHIRLIDLLDEDEKGRISFFLKNLCYSQGVTFAFEKREDGWYCAYAQTTPRDNFNRRLGRMIAKGRLWCEREGRTIFFGKDEPTYEDAVTLFDLLRYTRSFKDDVHA